MAVRSAPASRALSLTVVVNVTLTAPPPPRRTRLVAAATVVMLSTSFSAMPDAFKNPALCSLRYALLWAVARGSVAVEVTSILIPLTSVVVSAATTLVSEASSPAKSLQASVVVKPTVVLAVASVALLHSAHPLHFANSQ